jgi:hypothetical protein
MAFIVVVVELFATFPHSATCATSRQFRHDSNCYAWTVCPLKINAIVEFRTAGTIHLGLQLWLPLYIASPLWNPQSPKLPWMAARISFVTAAICQRLRVVSTDYAGSAICEQNSLLPAGQRQMYCLCLQYDGWYTVRSVSCRPEFFKNRRHMRKTHTFFNSK